MRHTNAPISSAPAEASCWHWTQMTPPLAASLQRYWLVPFVRVVAVVMGRALPIFVQTMPSVVTGDRTCSHILRKSGAAANRSVALAQEDRGKSAERPGAGGGAHTEKAVAVCPQHSADVAEAIGVTTDGGGGARGNQLGFACPQQIQRCVEDGLTCEKSRAQQKWGPKEEAPRCAPVCVCAQSLPTPVPSGVAPSAPQPPGESGFRDTDTKIGP